jgi:hypothetical protein
MAFLISFIMLVAIIPIAAVWSGFVLSILWGWFAVPAFGLPPLSIPAAIGVSMIASYLTYQYGLKSADGEDGGKSLLNVLLRPLVALMVGWVVHQFM